MSNARPDVVSNIASQTFSYSKAKDEGRIQTATNYVGPNGEDVELMFDRNGNQVLGQFFINGQRVKRDQIAFLRSIPKTAFDMPDDPQGEAKSSLLPTPARPLQNQQNQNQQNQNQQNQNQQTQLGQYPKTSTVVRSLGNGKFIIKDSTGQNVTVTKQSDGSYSAEGTT